MTNKPQCNISLDLIDNKELRSRIRKTMGIGHWNAYTRSEKYFSEQPTNVAIDSAELARHNKPDDMWIALDHQGKTVVYDITKFSLYHPGGVDVLLEYAGTDASEAFRTAHSYVSTNMISRLQKGYLIQSAPGRSGMPNQLSPFFIPSKIRLGSSKKPIWDWKELDSHVELIIDYMNNKVFNNFENELDILRILCTWTKADDMKTNSRGILMLRTVLDCEYHCLELSLRPQFHPDLSTLRLNHLQTDNSKLSLSPSAKRSGGRTELSINLVKISSTPQISLSTSSSFSSLSVQPDIARLDLVESSAKIHCSTIGTVLRDVCIGFDIENNSVSNEIFFICTILESHWLDNSCCYRLLCINWPESQVNINIPIGYHVNVRLKDVEGNYVIRPYTPIGNDPSFSSTVNTHYQQQNVNKFCLLIKIYPDGEFSSLVSKISENDKIEVSLPIGNFNNNLIKQIIHGYSKQLTDDNDQLKKLHVIMLAAGSGITPMIRIINYLLTNNNQHYLHKFKIHLIHFNRCQNDQVLVTYFESLSNCFPENFSVTEVLSEPLCISECGDNNNWLYGHITDELCRQCLGNEVADNFDSQTMCLICGPSGFNDAAIKLTNSWSIPKERVHVFKG
ncbi:Cytochrome b5 reductase 4 [Schistosoma japonicum]|uniref:Cytochrome b5 reductase 4 n=2 Tax=Schistosoma japonicum TaxID=6182 RepID=A0A4Z2CPI4_SCHJA|nr:Cytochrome b5 reductase 4 [Schistosoma japonicum]